MSQRPPISWRSPFPRPFQKADGRSPQHLSPPKLLARHPPAPGLMSEIIGPRPTFGGCALPLSLPGAPALAGQTGARSSSLIPPRATGVTLLCAAPFPFSSPTKVGPTTWNGILAGPSARGPNFHGRSPGKIGPGIIRQPAPGGAPKWPEGGTNLVRGVGRFFCLCFFCFFRRHNLRQPFHGPAAASRPGNDQPGLPPFARPAGWD